jgi:hypothetical protein
MSTKPLVIATIVAIKLSLSGYAAMAGPVPQTDVASVEQLAADKAKNSFMVVRAGSDRGFGGGSFGGRGFGKGFGSGFGGRGFARGGFAGRGWYGWRYGWYGCYPYYCY